MLSTVMVIDDEPTICELLVAVLQDEGYQVATAPHGRAALDTLATTRDPPGLIITDLMMPVMSGWEFCQVRLAMPPLAAIPVVVMSAANALPTQVAALGVVGALPKPLDLDALIALVKQYCPLI